jgi:death on curing protein
MVFAIKQPWNLQYHDLFKLDNNDLYPTVIDKAASLFESILVNHPFIDGNKRTGSFEFVINIASGTLKYDRIVSWLKANTES